MNRLWPGVIVGENTLNVHAGAIRKALGPYRSLLKTESGRGFRLLGSWTVYHEKNAPGPPGDLQRISVDGKSPRTNFPASVTRVVGREAAVQRLQDLVSAYRVVTLTGPGGIGKTTLALQVARRILDEFSGGGWLVELASSSDQNLVPATVAHTLGLRLQSDINSAEAVAGAIGEQKLLLVLDNCEHVIDAAANLAELLVGRCPNAAILATSREVLRIQGECIYRVPPLEVPATDTETQRILDHSAPELFVTRATEAGWDVASQSGNLPTIAAICRHLDGIPLAIEFAAARAATLGVDQVAAGLRDRFALLTSGRRTAIPRHRTLRATLDWSYHLLGEAEQLLLRRLAVFPAGFTFEAAVSVMKDARFDASAVITGIADLVTKSLVTLDRSEPVTRWYSLETIRAYALEKLTESGEIRTASRHLAEFFRGLVTRSAPLSDFSPRPESLAKCFREIDNTRAALDWAFSPSGDVEIGITLTAAHVPVWLKYSLVVECRGRTEQALKCLESIETPNTALQMRLMLGLGIALIFTFEPVERSKSVLGMVLDIAERSGTLDAQIRALYGLWAGQMVSRTLGRTALAMAEQIFSLAGRIGDAALLPVAHRALGLSLLRGGYLGDARRHLERVLEFDARASQEHEMWFLYNQHILARAMLARTLLVLGFADQAAIAAQSSLAEAMEGSSKLTLCIVLCGFAGPVAVMTGNQAAAGRAVTLLEDIAMTQGFRENNVRLAEPLQAMLLMARGELRSGVALLRAEFESDKRGGRKSTYPTALGALAEGLAELGELTNALAIVDEGLAIGENTGERWDVPELLRIKGEVFLKRKEIASNAAAEDCFRRASEMAREQGALFWELRIALSLARLRITQGRGDEAREVLQPVYERFVEGFATTDLRSARAVLDALSGRSR